MKASTICKFRPWVQALVFILFVVLLVHWERRQGFLNWMINNPVISKPLIDHTYKKSLDTFTSQNSHF